MKKTRIIFLRHADVEKDPNLSAVLWKLSEKGKKQAEEIANLVIMNTVDVIYVSEERKTALTIKPLAKILGKKIKQLSFFNEVKRGDKFLTKEEFETEKKRQLTNLNYHAFEGESAKEALTRFKQGVRQILEKNIGKTILIVTHGTILNIYFADLLNVFDELFERWQKTSFSAYGVVENGVVVKDIVF